MRRPAPDIRIIHFNACPASFPRAARTRSPDVRRRRGQWRSDAALAVLGVAVEVNTHFR
jgi:hypothetical protein